MENTLHEAPVETFEDVVQPLTHFKNCVLNLSERYKDIVNGLSYLNDNSLEDKLQRYLKYPQNIQTLQNYIKILKRCTSEKINNVLLDEEEKFKRYLLCCSDELRLQYSWYTEDVRSIEMNEVHKSLTENINDTIALITGILNNYKATSIKTKYFDNPVKPKIKHPELRAFESTLIKGQLIERHIDFVKIFRGQAPDEKVNWISTPSSFKYFIDELFKKEPFKDEKQKWIIASNTFTIHGNPTPINIHRHKAKDANKGAKLIINDAISCLID